MQEFSPEILSSRIAKTPFIDSLSKTVFCVAIDENNTIGIFHGAFDRDEPPTDRKYKKSFGRIRRNAAIAARTIGNCFAFFFLFL